MSKNMKFPTDLKCHKYEIERIGRRLGYKFRPIVYEMVDSEHMSELAAFHGYPERYHHWTFGQESYQLKTQLTRFGLGTIYEMVVPTHPCYAYLLDTNLLLSQKSVMAHVVGHKDFFDNNFWFVNGVPDNLHRIFADNANKIDEFRAQVGRPAVDNFIERCLSLDNMIDILDASLRRLPFRDGGNSHDGKLPKEPFRIKTRGDFAPYLDKILNPPELLEKKQKVIDLEEKRESDILRGLLIPESPVRDIMGFLYKYSSLEPWQREIVRIIGQESHDLSVGAQTQIMNEGWASTSEALIMVDELAGDASEMSCFARHYSSVLRPGQGINPYLLGRDLWQDIKWRFDTGRHGTIYDECKQIDIIDRWDEFIVFKVLAERYGTKNLLSNESFKRDWSEFCTLIEETMSGRGAILPAFFCKNGWVVEWLALDSVEATLEDFQRKLTKVSLAEQEIAAIMEKADLTCDDPLRFKFRYEVCKSNKFDPDLDWTEEEVISKIDYLLKLRKFRNGFDDNLIKRSSYIIPESWIDWVNRYGDKVELGRGQDKMFEVRGTYNDVSFIREFFTEEFCQKKGFFTIGIAEEFDQNSWTTQDVYVAKSKNFEKIREAIISSRLNLGGPKIELVDANFNNNRELLLVYRADGRGDLDVPDIPEVLSRLYHVWGYNKPVHLETFETKYPSKAPWYDRWRPDGSPAPPKDRPTRKVLRWTLTGAVFERKEIMLKDAHPVTRAIYIDLLYSK